MTRAPWLIAIPLPPLIELYSSSGTTPSDEPRISIFAGIGLHARRPGPIFPTLRSLQAVATPHRFWKGRAPERWTPVFTGVARVAVEFSDHDGRTYAQAALEGDRLGQSPR